MKKDKIHLRCQKYRMGDTPSINRCKAFATIYRKRFNPLKTCNWYVDIYMVGPLEK